MALFKQHMLLQLRSSCRHQSSLTVEWAFCNFYSFPLLVQIDGRLEGYVNWIFSDLAYSRRLFLLFWRLSTSVKKLSIGMWIPQFQFPFLPTLSWDGVSDLSVPRELWPIYNFIGANLCIGLAGLVWYDLGDPCSFKKFRLLWIWSYMN